MPTVWYKVIMLETLLFFFTAGFCSTLAPVVFPQHELNKATIPLQKHCNNSAHGVRKGKQKHVFPSLVFAVTINTNEAHLADKTWAFLFLYQMPKMPGSTIDGHALHSPLAQPCTSPAPVFLRLLQLHIITATGKFITSLLSRHIKTDPSPRIVGDKLS